MKKKKEIEIPKTEYIYQRYNGTITKYIVDNEYYIAVGTGIATKKDETAFLGKVAENIIDLIEVGDIVFIEDFSGYDFIYINDKEMLEALKQDVKDGVRIKSILTKELYQANCYTVERKEKC